MVRTRGGHTDPSASREARLSASAPQDPSQASQALTYHLLRVRVPTSPSSAGLRETSSQAPVDSQAPGDIQRPSGMLLKSSSRDLWLPRRPFWAIQMVELGHFTLSSTLTWRLCNNSWTFEIRLHCSKRRPEPTTICFSIDKCQGILEARHIAEALHIPFQPEDLE
ncbi:hypothetical protein CK203_112875 [Vitis vinifera]|uniref:Uncharacterized protein n=1 Tax=Vitis vinifera TaxID=29760 RepID=A0A438CV02_VITVI|nr:hypothetical protein CK203_112875 [Vitis vinifera]